MKLTPPYSMSALIWAVMHEACTPPEKKRQ
jgi:hypothetical protein